MPSKREPTDHPGIYRYTAADGSESFQIRIRVNGRQRSKSFDNITAAKKAKKAMETDRDRGELRGDSKITLQQWADEWLPSYRGNGKRGFTEGTREDYERDLNRWILPRLGHLQLTEITPHTIDQWIGWLCKQDNGNGGELADATVRRIVCPIRSALGSAMRAGLIRSNPCDGAVLPYRPRIEEEGDARARAFTREQLDSFLRVVNPSWKLFFETLASSGMRWSEIIALQWGDIIKKDGDTFIQVRRAIVKGREKPPKSKAGRRDIPIGKGLAAKLAKRRREECPDRAQLIFPSKNGTPLRQENVRRRILAPAAGEAGAGWAGFHTFRHTFASMAFARKINPKRIQVWLGHHALSFTMDTYTHLIPDDRERPIDLEEELGRDNTMTTHATEPDRNQTESDGDFVPKPNANGTRPKAAGRS